MARRKTAIAPVVNETRLKLYRMLLGGWQGALNVIFYNDSAIYASTQRTIKSGDVSAYIYYDKQNKIAKLDGIHYGTSLQSVDAFREHMKNVAILCDLADEFARKFEAGEYSEVERG